MNLCKYVLDLTHLQSCIWNKKWRWAREWKSAHSAVTAINLFGSFAHTWFSLMWLQTNRLYVYQMIKMQDIANFWKHIYLMPVQVPNQFATNCSCFEHMGRFSDPVEKRSKIWVAKCRVQKNKVIIIQKEKRLASSLF